MVCVVMWCESSLRWLVVINCRGLSGWVGYRQLCRRVRNETGCEVDDEGFVCDLSFVDLITQGAPLH